MDFIAEQWLLCSILATLVAAFLVLESRKGGVTVSFHQATQLINRGEAVVLDVRDGAEYKAGHIIDAINIPYASLGGKVDHLEKYKDKQVIVVDKMGQHAGAAGKILRDSGYQVVRLQGGISEWSHQNLPLVKS